MAFLVLALAACARMQPLERIDDVKLGVPSDLATKFAVQDVAPAAPAVAPAGTPSQTTTASLPSAPAAGGKKSSQQAPAPVVKKPVSAKQDKVWKNRWTMNEIFHPGDRALYDITYFGTIAGTFELKVLPYKRIGEREVFHLQGMARTASVFSLFYRLNDMAESFLDREALLTHKFAIKLDESWQQRELVELYDRKVNKLYYWNKVEHKKKGNSQDQFTRDIDKDAQDIMSAVFVMRTLPLEVGKSYRIPVISNGKPYEVHANVIRKEELETKAGTFPAIVVQPVATFDGILQSKGDVFFWISDDAHRSLLKIDAKVKIGSVIAYVRELEYGPETAAR